MPRLSVSCVSTTVPTCTDRTEVSKDHAVGGGWTRHETPVGRLEPRRWTPSADTTKSWRSPSASTFRQPTGSRRAASLGGGWRPSGRRASRRTHGCASCPIPLTPARARTTLNATMITTRGPSSLCSTRCWPHTPAPLTTATSACGKGSAISTPVMSASPSILAAVSGGRGRERRPPFLLRCWMGQGSSSRVGGTCCSTGRCQAQGTGVLPTCGRATPGATCRPPSSGPPITPGASRTTSTHTGRGSGRTPKSSIVSSLSHGWMWSVPIQATGSRSSTEQLRPAVEDCSLTTARPRTCDFAGGGGVPEGRSEGAPRSSARRRSSVGVGIRTSV